MSAYHGTIAERITWANAAGQLTATEAKVLSALWSCGDYETGRSCRAYSHTLAARANLSRATVTRTLADLRDTQRPGGPLITVGVRGHRQATGYDIQVDRLAAAPPKEQQVSLSPVLEHPAVEAQIEPQGRLEAHDEPQTPPDYILEAQFEPPILKNVRTHTHTPRAREADTPVEAQIEPLGLPLLGPPPPPKCTHPHMHAWCDGRVHVPRALHFEFLDRLGAVVGETRTAKAGRLVAFYAADQAQLPATTSVGNPFTYWNAAFDAWVRPAPVPQAPRSTPTFHAWLCPHDPRCGNQTTCAVVSARKVG